MGKRGFGMIAHSFRDFRSAVFISLHTPIAYAALLIYGAGKGTRISLVMAQVFANANHVGKLTRLAVAPLSWLLFQLMRLVSLCCVAYGIVLLSLFALWRDVPQFLTASREYLSGKA